MVTSIVLIRHAETEIANLEDSRIPGPSLSDVGRAQAKKTAKFLEKSIFSKVYTSHMARAIETAKIITNQKLIKRDELNEFNKIVFEEQPEHVDKFNENIERALKTKAFFEEILRNERDSKILIVAHGNVIRYLIGCSLNLKPHKAPNFFIDNCAITHLFFDGNQLISVDCINSTTHLFPE